MMWLRVPQMSSDGSLQRGRIFDCGDSVSARIDGTYLRVNVTLNQTLPNGTPTSTLVRQSLEVMSITGTQYNLMVWNHIAITLQSRVLGVYFNGILANQTSLNSTYLFSNTNSCTIGNNMTLVEPLNGHIRHMAFLNQSVNVTQYQHSTILPSDSNVLAYFKFDKYTGLYEAYSYNQTRNYMWNNLTIGYSSEPETACYCAYQGPPVLSISSISQLKPLNMSAISSAVDMTGAVQATDANGITLKFWTTLRIANRNDSQQFANGGQQVLVSVVNYTDIVLVNSQSSYMRVDLYNRSQNASRPIATKFNMSGYTPQYNTWTLFEVQITSTQIVLFANGYQVATVHHSVAIPSVPFSNLSISVLPYINQTQYNQIQMLIYSLTLYKNLASNLSSISPAIYVPLLISARLLPTNFTDSGSLAGVFQELTTFQFTGDQVQWNIFQNYSQYFESQDNDLQWYGNATFEQYDQDFCTRTQSSQLFDGISCANTKSSLGFSLSSQSNYLSGKLTSYSAPQFSVDFWYRPQYVLSGGPYNDSVLFANYDMFNQTIVKIVLSYSQGAVICNIRNDSLYQYSSWISESDVTWSHITCVFNISQAFSYLYNQPTNVSVTNSTTIAQLAISNQTTFMTLIGNSLDGSGQSQAFIKEVRILKSVISANQMQLLRFVKQTKQSWVNRGYLMEQVSLSEGYQGYYFNSSTDRIPMAAANQILASWTTDNSLTVCPTNSLFDGTCCAPQNITQVTLSIVQTLSPNGYVSLSASLSNMTDAMVSLSYFNWTLSHIIGSPTITNQLQIDPLSLGPQQGASIILIPTNLLYYNSSYGFNITVDTPIYSRMLNAQYNLTIQCPTASIINASSGPIIQQYNYETKLVLSSLAILSCYGQAPIQVKSISWISNNTNASTPWTVSTDLQTITFNKEQNIIPNTTLLVSYSAVLNNQTFNDSRIVQFLQYSVILSIANLSPDGVIYIPYGSDLVIDASQTQFLSNTIPLNQMAYNITCPNGSIIGNMTQYCQFNQSTGILRVPWSQLVNPIADIYYGFNVTVGKPRSLYATANQTFFVKWFYQASNVSCPGINSSVAGSSMIFRPNISSFMYTPQFDLDCLLSDGITYQRYNRTNVSYSINTTRMQYLTSQFNQTANITNNFNDTFNLTSNGYQFSFKNASIMSRLKPGDIIPITINSTATSRDTNISSNLSLSMDISLQLTPIIIIANSSHGDPLVGLRPVQFNETLVMNASLSYDPDYSNYTGSSLVYNTSVLAYQYLCNNVSCVVPSSQMNKGVLTLTPFDRVRLGYLYNQSMTFQIIATNPLVPLKPYQQAIFVANFSQPLSNGTAKCPYPIFQSIYINSTGKNVTINATTNFTFDATNATTLKLNIILANCSTLQYQQNMIAVNLSMPQLISDGLQSYQFVNSGQGQLTFPMSQMTSTLQLNQSVSVQAFLLYNYTNTTTKAWFIGYQLSQFTIFRQFSTIIPSISASYNYISGQQQAMTSYTIGQEEFAIILSSYTDLDHQQNIGATFNYTCDPQILQSYCQSIQNLTNFSLNKSERVSFGINQINSSFWIALTIITSNLRLSSTANITFTVSQQNFSKCISVSDPNTQLQVLGLDTLVQPIILRPHIAYFCDSTDYIQDGFTWSSQQSNSSFWSSYSVGTQQNDFQIGITPSQLSQISNGPGSQIQLQASAQLRTYSGSQYQVTNFSNVIQYTIQVQPDPIQAQLQVPNLPIDISTSYPYLITVEILPFNSAGYSGLWSCYYVCFFGTVEVDNCSNSTNCTFDIVGAVEASLNQTSLTLANLTMSSVFVSVTTPAGVFNSSAALNFYNQSMATPTCDINNTENPLYLVDQEIAFACNCSNYSPNNLTYMWQVYTYDPQSDSQSSLALVTTNNGMTGQSLVLSPFALAFVQSSYIQVYVQATSMYNSSLQFQTSIIIPYQNSSNIVQGVVTILPINSNQQYPIATIIGIQISGQQDLNGGQLYNQIKYQTQQNQVVLVSKTTQTTFYTILPPSVGFITIETYDQRGALVIQTIPLNISSIDITLTWATSDFSNYLNTIVLNTLSPTPVQNILNLENILVPTDLEVASHTLEIATSALISLSGNYDQASVSSFKYLLGMRAITYIQAYIVSQTSSQQCNAMLNGLDRSMMVLNQCFSALLQSQTLSLLHQINSSAWDQTNAYAQAAIQQYYILVSNVAAMGNLSPSDSQFINVQEQQFNVVQRSNMKNGAILQLNNQNTEILKIVPSQWTPGQNIIVATQNTTFSMNPSVLSILAQSSIFVSVQAYTNYSVDPIAYPQLQLLGNVVEIDIQDGNSNIITTLNGALTANITFSGAQLHGNNISCGYFNPTSSQWLLNSDGNLQTIIDAVNNQVICQTPHLSMFSIFNVSYPQSTPLTTPTNTISSNSQNEEIAVSIIQLGFIIVSIVLFVLNYRSETASRKAFVANNDFKSFEEKITFGNVICSFNPFLSTLRPLAFNRGLRILIFLNYLLYVSLFVLSNMAILEEGCRSVGDVIYLIVSICLVFMFASPIVQNRFIYSHVHFIPTQKFANIFKTKVNPPLQNQEVEPHTRQHSVFEQPPQTDMIMDEIVLVSGRDIRNSESIHTEMKLKSNHSSSDSDLKKVQFAQSFEEEEKSNPPTSDRGQIPQQLQHMNSHHHITNPLNGSRHETSRHLDFENVQADQEVGMPHVNHILHPSLIDDKSAIKEHSNESQDDYVFESESSDAGHSRELGINLNKMNQIKRNANPNGSASKILNKIQEKSQYPDEEYQFEGGDGQTIEQGPRHNSYKQKEFKIIGTTTPDGVKESDKQIYCETHTTNSKPILLFQAPVCIVGIAINAFLFSWVGISDSAQIQAYFAGLIISLVFLLIIFDSIISYTALRFIKSNGIKDIRVLSSVFILGFIGMNRIRCLQ